MIRAFSKTGSTHLDPDPQLWPKGSEKPIKFQVAQRGQTKFRFGLETDFGIFFATFVSENPF